ncbi:hypothetical protein FKM82_017525 [Ascaphus truei]
MLTLLLCQSTNNVIRLDFSPKVDAWVALSIPCSVETLMFGAPSTGVGNASPQGPPSGQVFRISLLQHIWFNQSQLQHRWLNQSQLQHR